MQQNTRLLETIRDTLTTALTALHDVRKYYAAGFMPSHVEEAITLITNHRIDVINKLANKNTKAVVHNCDSCCYFQMEEHDQFTSYGYISVPSYDCEKAGEGHTLPIEPTFHCHSWTPRTVKTLS